MATTNKCFIYICYFVTPNVVSQRTFVKQHFYERSLSKRLSFFIYFTLYNCIVRADNTTQRTRNR